MAEATITFRASPKAATTPAAVTATPSARGAGTTGWLVSREIDLLFSCGGLLWILFALQSLISINGVNVLPGPAVEWLTVLAVLGTHVLGEGHIAATLHRVYHNPERRRSLSLYTHWAALAAAAVGLFCLTNPACIAILLKIYLLWTVQHFTAQSYGMTLAYCYRSGYHPGRLEKRLIWGVANATMAFAIIRQLTYKEWGSAVFLGQTTPFWGPLPEWLLSLSTSVLLGFTVAVAVVIVCRSLQKGELMPLPALLMMATGVLIFTLDRESTGNLWIYAPAFYHGSQYLVLTLSCRLKELGVDLRTAAGDTWGRLAGGSSLRYIGQMVMMGVFILVGVPHILSQFGFDTNLSVAVVFAVVNIHHFITDGAIWKLRDPAVRAAIL